MTRGRATTATAALTAVIVLSLGYLLRPVWTEGQRIGELTLVGVIVVADVGGRLAKAIAARLTPDPDPDSPRSAVAGYLAVLSRVMNVVSLVAVVSWVWSILPPQWSAVLLGVAATYYWHMRRKLYRSFGGPISLTEATQLNKISANFSAAWQAAQSGEMAAALSITEDIRAHPLFQKYPKPAAALALMGSSWLLAQGEVQRAEEEVRWAIGVFEGIRIADASALGEAWVALGQILYGQDRYDEATGAFERAISVAGPRMYRLNRVTAEGKLAEIAYATGDSATAQVRAREALRLARGWHIHLAAAFATEILAMLGGDRGDSVEAESLMEEAAEFYRLADAGPHRWVRFHIIRGTLRRTAGHVEAALADFMRAMEFRTAVRSGWGDRQMQARFASRSSFIDEQALDAIERFVAADDPRGALSLRRILAIDQATNLRGMLGFTVTAGTRPGSAQGSAESALTQTMAEIAALERTSDEDTAASRSDPAGAYERLESLVSFRFRQSLEALPAVCEPDYRRLRHHVLQLRLLERDERAQLAAVWTPPGDVPEARIHTLTPQQAAAIATLTGWTPDTAGTALPGGVVTDNPTASMTASSTEPSDTGISTSVEALRSRFSTVSFTQTSRYTALAAPDPTMYAAAAEALLPPALRVALLERASYEAPFELLVVPDATLWAVPWAALPLVPPAARQAEGHDLLVDRAVISYLPSLSLAGSASPARPVQSVVGYFAGVNDQGIAIERSALERSFRHHVETINAAGAFVNRLLAGSLGDLLVVSVHGDGQPGLAHSVDLGGGESLSAASFLTASFPRTVFLNACLSGELDPRHGTEPIALSTMALCRGADTVVAGQFPLPDGPSVDPDRDHVTARLLAHTYEALAGGHAPAAALRRAQCAIRAESLIPVPLHWAGLIALGMPD